MKVTLVCFFIFLKLFSLKVADAQYPFIRYDLNKIVLPHDSSSWIDFSAKFNAAKKSKEGKLNILHIGDSHIQGDYFTGQIRKDLFQYLDIKNQSRGITLPYFVAGTNGPDELLSGSQGVFQNFSIRKAPEKYFSITGYSIETSDSVFVITLKDTSNYRFNKIQVMHSPFLGQQLKINMQKPALIRKISDSLTISEFIFDELQTEFNLLIQDSKSSSKFAIYGVNLKNTFNEILYHSVGINGATFGLFLQFREVNNILNYLIPDCIIISYGTNDALNKSLDATQLKKNISNCINVIRNAIPTVPVIFTTPGDYLINKKYPDPRAALITKIIKEVALENNCAYWDFYNIMGGSGSVRDWYKYQLVFKDWIHLSKKGYRLQGDLFFSAFLKLKDLNNDL